MREAETQRISSFATVFDRQTRMLRTAMGPTIAAALDDPEIVEVLLNPDGSLWFDRQGAGRAPTGEHSPPRMPSGSSAWSQRT